MSTSRSNLGNPPRRREELYIFKL